jgi:alkylation response protein AidB-like acyl-CoA dehydrogenase
MELDIPHDDPRRLEVRSWLADHPSPTGRQLAEAGYVVPHWPRPWGINADPVHQLIVDDELRRARVRRPMNLIGIGWAAPTIIMGGDVAQIDRYVWPALAGEEIWCQLFSEPGAGSDLASLRTSAVRDGDVYVVNGTKVWTSAAHKSQFGILLVRTDPDAPKHRGISYFICPLDLPGITIRPIVDMTRAHSFNEVFFDDVRLPAALRVGDENDGWRLAKVTLGNERAGLSSGGSLWGSGPSATDLVELVRGSRQQLPPVLRQRLAALHIEGEVLRLMQERSLSAVVLGRERGAEASVQKLLADEHGQRVMALAKDLAGANGMLTGSGPEGRLPPRATIAPSQNRVRSDHFPDVDPIWHYGYLFAPALTIGGGTWAVQRNIIGERALGLPHEPDVDSPSA